MKKHYLYLPAGLALLSGGNAFAYNSFTTGVERISTEDETHDAYVLEYKHKTQQGTNFGLRTEKHNFKNPEYKYNGKAIYAQGSTHITPNIQLNGGVGSMRISRSGDNATSKTLTPYHVGAQAQFGKRVQVEVRHGRMPGYMRHSIASGKTGEILSEEATSVELKTRPMKRVKFNVKHEKIKLSDGNGGNRTKAGVYYGLTPNIWVGVEGTKRKYNQQDVGYWSPKNASSYAVTLDADMPISDKAKLNASLSAGRAKEEGYSGQTKTLSASLGAEFEVSKNVLIGAHAYHEESRENGAKHKENGAMLNLTYRWG